MARVSLFCTVAGGRSLPCRSLSLVWQQQRVLMMSSTTTEKLMPPRMGGGNVAVVVRRPFTFMRLGSHWRADSQLPWRKGSHLMRGVTTAPEAKGEQQLLLRGRQQQTAKYTSEEGRELAAEIITNDEGNLIRKFKPDHSKRMLKIPQEEWPR